MVAPPRPSLDTSGRKLKTLLVAVVGLVAIVAVGVVLGVVVVKRMKTGTWQAPKIADVVNVVKSEPLVVEDPNPTSKVIFLERGKVALTPGRDRAVDGISSVLISGKNGPVTTSGFTGSTKTWGQIRTCVTTLFKPFAVQITDVRPIDTDNFAMVIVGGSAKEIGVNNSRIGGLAPFSSAVIGRPIVFAFSTALQNNVRAVCETIGMEVAHAYGLDHSFLCKDVMTYLSGCGTKSFVDKNLRCGEKKARDCQNGQPTQNSFQHLLKILGPATTPLPTATPTGPVISGASKPK